MLRNPKLQAKYCKTQSHNKERTIRFTPPALLALRFEVGVLLWRSKSKSLANYGVAPHNTLNLNGAP